jgi:hypothetical protein
MVYRRLWRIFYNSVAIKERENLRARAARVPERYRAAMPEFQGDEQTGVPAILPADT